MYGICGFLSLLYIVWCGIRIRVGGDNMSSSGNFKSVCVGVISGIAVGMIGEKLMENKMNKPMKKKMNKAIHAVEEMVDTAQYMFK